MNVLWKRRKIFLNFYFQGELGTYIKSPWRDLVDANATVGDIYKHWKKGMKHNTQYSWKQFKDYQPFTGARTAQRRFDNAEPGKEASKKNSWNWISRVFVPPKELWNP